MSNVQIGFLLGDITNDYRGGQLERKGRITSGSLLYSQPKLIPVN